MAILLVPAAAFTLATLLLATLWRLGLALLKRKAPGFWGRTLRWHCGLFAFHLFVTVPVLLGILLSRGVGTRRDERAYAGPRIAADGTWIEQTRDSLAAEHDGTSSVDAALAQAAAARTVTFKA